MSEKNYENVYINHQNLFRYLFQLLINSWEKSEYKHKAV